MRGLERAVCQHYIGQARDRPKRLARDPIRTRQCVSCVVHVQSIRQSSRPEYPRSGARRGGEGKEGISKRTGTPFSAAGKSLVQANAPERP
jgi:hypothetical protein